MAINAQRLAIQSINRKAVNLDSSCLSKHLHGKDQPMKILLPQKDPFDSHQGATFDSYPFAAFHQGMRFKAGTAIDSSPDGLDLGVRNSGRLGSG
jgi:hypothetical protein